MREARERRDKALAAYRSNPTAFNAAEHAALTCERQLAAAKGDAYAVPIDFPVQANVGAPLPLLFCSDNRCILTFYCEEPANRDSEAEWLSAIVEFDVCFSAKLGSPSENGFETHPLCGRGGDPGSAQQVMNSCWLREVEAIDRGHAPRDAASAQALKHFIFWFHDSTFECLAQSFRVELVRESRASIVARASQRLLD